AAEQVARPEIASVAGVMRDQLAQGPVERAEIGAAQSQRWGALRAHAPRSEQHAELDREAAALLIQSVAQVRQRSRVFGSPRRGGNPEGLERLEGHDPGRNGAGETLGKKGAERL